MRNRGEKKEMGFETTSTFNFNKERNIIKKG